jgi:catechol 2,3-dioxygenase-like lactoylglutathione lyase family enzyme
MPGEPELRFVSLFVPDIDEAARRYEQVLGVAPMHDDRTAPHPHPFAASAPVVFALGSVSIALYEANPPRGTHPGDVGIGLCVEGSPAGLVERAAASGARVLYGPKRAPGDGREIAVLVLPDRHFFELVGS